MKQDEYFGNYTGIVIQNNDPSGRGRIKVYMSHLHDLYENWYNIKIDKQFKFLGENIDSSLNPVLEDLKAALPWAECAAPLAGESSPGRYNAYFKSGSISDSNRWYQTVPDEDYKPGKTALNKDGIGESPGRKYEIQFLRLHDGFSQGEDYTSEDIKESKTDGVKRPNKYTYNYTPNTYSNLAKGSFGVPSVGSHVWCFFREGSINSPVYFAAAFNKDAWNGIYDSGDSKNPGSDYPGAYENTPKTGDSDPVTPSAVTYRNKFVINQKGGALEFINTDKREGIKLTHYSGSFKSFDNNTNTELATENDQKLVLKDQYLTVNGYRNVLTERDLDYIVRGNHFQRIGIQDTAGHRHWREAVRELEKIKQLFEIQRTQYVEGEETILAGFNMSQFQLKDGTHAPCPVCAKDNIRHPRAWHINNSYSAVTPTRRKHGVNESSLFSKKYVQYPTRKAADLYLPQANFDKAGTIMGETCPVCNGTGISPSSMDGIFNVEPRKKLGISKDAEGKEVIDPDGWFAKIAEVQRDLIETERGLGDGGSQFINIAKHKIETVGMVMNDFGNIRTDVRGKMYKDRLRINTKGVYESFKESPLIEYVHVDDLPGGSYTLNICNRWNVQVGAGGISMKSYGPLSLGGTIVNMSGEQVNIGSRNEVVIDGGKRLELVADILSIRQRKREQVLIDSSLGVANNVIIGGGCHIEGDLSLHHITAPVEIQETELTEVWGRAEHKEKLIIGYIDDGTPIPNCNGKKSPPTPVYSKLDQQDNYCGAHYAQHNSLRGYKHSHDFKNLPLHLKATNDEVRDAGKDCQWKERVRPERVETRRARDKVHGKKGPGWDTPQSD
jgi:hypothetical protein